MIFKGLIVLMMASLVSYGAADVTCWNGDCMNQGWTWTDVSGLKNDYGCYREGCQKSGWIVKGPGRSAYTQCKSAGCFKEGWYEVGQENQNLLRTIVCRGNDDNPQATDCLKNGWVIYSSSGQDAVISCHQHDCEKKGWLVQSSYQMFQVYCKAGGCFVNGWKEM